MDLVEGEELESCDTDDISLEEQRAAAYAQKESQDSSSENNNKPPASLDNLDPPLAPFIEDVHSPESFTSFIFWREPLPNIPDQDIQRLSSPELEEASPMPTTSDAEVSALAQQLNTADLLSSEEQQETVANIGSEHVLGQLVGETTLTIQNGVVQDVGGSASLGYCPAEDANSTHSSEADDRALLQQALQDQVLIDYQQVISDDSTQ
jgi:hypothetical protein